VRLSAAAISGVARRNLAGAPCRNLHPERRSHSIRPPFAPACSRAQSSPGQVMAPVQPPVWNVPASRVGELRSLRNAQRVRFTSADESRRWRHGATPRPGRSSRWSLARAHVVSCDPARGGGPLGLIAALSGALRASGTLVMPAMTNGETVFDPHSTPCEGMGVTAERFRRQRSVVRSTHPGGSFAAARPLAGRSCAPQPLTLRHTGARARRGACVT
jgi:hypothetical protein